MKIKEARVRVLTPRQLKKGMKVLYGGHQAEVVEAKGEHIILGFGEGREFNLFAYNYYQIIDMVVEDVETQ